MKRLSLADHIGVGACIILMMFILFDIFLPAISKSAPYGSLHDRDFHSYDDATNGKIVIDFDHHEIHEQDSYTMHYQNDTTNISEMTVIAFITPDTTQEIHLVAIAESDDVAEFAIYETPSIDRGEGTDLDIWNRNRNGPASGAVSSLASPVTVGFASKLNEATAAAANITTTTQIHHEHLGSSGSPVTSTGGATRGTSEFVLKRNTEYAVVLSALTDNDSVHNMQVNFYQHTPR